MDLVNKNDVMKNAKGFTFTFAEERKRYVDFLEYCLDNAPPVEAKPVVYGEWKHLGGDEWCCSACGHVISTEGSWEKPEKKFCENCGADMRKKVE